MNHSHNKDIESNITVPGLNDFAMGESDGTGLAVCQKAVGTGTHND
ncbi:hypothetical protein ACED66_22290 [Vibrio splendidus]|nr:MULTISPECIES: hypothetical protein [Vibrio]CDT82775.1 hypothetical protein VCR3J2_260026 [Vibrio coralliirubri]